MLEGESFSTRTGILMAEPSNGAFVPSEEVLAMVTGVSLQLKVVETKLDIFVQNDEKRAAEIAEIRKEVSDLKARLYGMSAIISIGGSVITAFITNAITSR